MEEKDRAFVEEFRVGKGEMWLQSGSLQIVRMK